MRVLVVDQDSASNEAIARSLRELFTVDAVTNKGDCLDLLRSNTFEVIVATERLEDGSGLELLGQIAKKYPAVLRIFAADRQRLALLKGRLGPFELFQTLTYPIDPDRLIASLSLAEAAQEAHADTSNIQHVVLTAESIPEEVIDEFPEPQPIPRAAAGHSQSGPGAGRAGSRTPSHRSRSSAPPSSAGARPLRHRGRGSGRHSPVRFPAREFNPPLDAPRPPATSQDFRSSASESDSLNDAVAIARAARSDFESSSSDGADVQQLAIKAGIGVAGALVLVLLGFKLFGSSKSPAAPHAAPAPVARAPVVEAPPPAPVVAPPKHTNGKSTVARSGSKRSRHAETAANGASAPVAASTPSPQAPESRVAPQAPATSSSVATSAADGPAFPPETPPGLTRPGAKGAPSTAATIATASDATRPEAASSADAAAGSAAAAPTSEPAGSAAPAPAPAAPTFAAAPSTAPVSAPAAAASAAAASVASNSAAAAPVTSASGTAAPAHVPSSSGSTHTRSSSEPPPVIKEAKLIRRVDPDYPSAAKRDGVKGFVDLEVTVSPSGNVGSVSVVRANPSDLFDKAALAAVRKWKYDPRFVDGLPTEAHVKVHLEFGPDR